MRTPRKTRWQGHWHDGYQTLANLPAALAQNVHLRSAPPGIAGLDATIFPATPHDAVDAGAGMISHSSYLVWEAAPHVPSDYAMRAMGDFEQSTYSPDAPAILTLLIAIGHGVDRGTIAPGNRADTIVLDADPARGIHNTTKIDFVIKNGAIYRRKPRISRRIPLEGENR